jgi:hypothetical protein
VRPSAKKSAATPTSTTPLTLGTVAEAAATSDTGAVPVTSPEVPDLASLGFTGAPAAQDAEHSRPGTPLVSLTAALGATVIGLGLLGLLWASGKRARLHYG